MHPEREIGIKIGSKDKGSKYIFFNDSFIQILWAMTATA